jgi:hypothetical protein
MFLWFCARKCNLLANAPELPSHVYCQEVQGEFIPEVTP